MSLLVRCPYFRGSVGKGALLSEVSSFQGLSKSSVGKSVLFREVSASGNTPIRNFAGGTFRKFHVVATICESSFRVFSCVLRVEYIHKVFSQNDTFSPITGSFWL